MECKTEIVFSEQLSQHKDCLADMAEDFFPRMVARVSEVSFRATSVLGPSQSISSSSPVVKHAAAMISRIIAKVVPTSCGGCGAVASKHLESCSEMTCICGLKWCYFCKNAFPGTAEEYTAAYDARTRGIALRETHSYGAALSLDYDAIIATSETGVLVETPIPWPHFVSDFFPLHILNDDIVRCPQWSNRFSRGAELKLMGYMMEPYVDAASWVEYLRLLVVVDTLHRTMSSEFLSLCSEHVNFLILPTDKDPRSYKALAPRRWHGSCVMMFLAYKFNAVQAIGEFSTFTFHDAEIIAGEDED